MLLTIPGVIQGIFALYNENDIFVSPSYWESRYKPMPAMTPTPPFRTRDPVSVIAVRRAIEGRRARVLVRGFTDGRASAGTDTWACVTHAHTSNGTCHGTTRVLAAPSGMSTFCSSTQCIALCIWMEVRPDIPIWTGASDRIGSLSFRFYFVDRS